MLGREYEARLRDLMAVEERLAEIVRQLDGFTEFGIPPEVSGDVNAAYQRLARYTRERWASHCDAVQYNRARR